MQYISGVSGKSAEVIKVKERMLSSNPILEGSVAVAVQRAGAGSLPPLQLQRRWRQWSSLGAV